GRASAPPPPPPPPDLPAVVVRVTGADQHGIDMGALAAHDVRGKAVLLHTGDDAQFGTPAYATERHFLTRAGSAWLADHGAALVGIDGLNIETPPTANGPHTPCFLPPTSPSSST